MPRAVIISSNNELVRFFELELEMCGYVSDTARDMGEASDQYALLILDVDTVPYESTDEYTCPVVRVSSNISSLSDSGNVLTWPTRIADIRRVCAGYASNKTCVGIHTVSVDTICTDTISVVDRESFTVLIGNKHVRLTKNEFIILEELCRANGETVSRQHIMELLGAENGNISDVYICYLRKKLEGAQDQGKRLIFTERGRGYRTPLKMI